MAKKVVSFLQICVLGEKKGRKKGKWRRKWYHFDDFRGRNIKFAVFRLLLFGEKIAKTEKRREKWYHFFKNGTFRNETLKMAKKMVSFLYIIP